MIGVKLMESAIQKLLKERYYLEHENTWEDIALRVSSIYPPAFELINNKEFIPSTPTLMNANTQGLRKGTLSSCFTMDIHDSISGIFDALKEGALVSKAAGGVGYVFSKLRSSREEIKTIKRTSSGPIPFMKIFNTMLEGVTQGGARKGAGMGQFDIDHPDILDVIRLKSTKGEMERLNLSIRIPDSFYEQLLKNPKSPHIVYLMDGTPETLIDNGKIVTVGAMWDEIVEYAWLCAEPGIFNKDIAHRQCTVTNLNNYVLSNPCQEFTNIPYASCNLGSMNLTKFVNDDGTFNWSKFVAAVRTSTRFLNNVIDANDFPLEVIKDVTLKVRPIGLGVMGFAHMLFMMRLPFNSLTATQLSDEIFSMLTLVSMDESAEIAKETGVTYPAFDKDLYMKANERFFNLSGTHNSNGKVQFVRQLQEKILATGIANSCNTSLAPTGTISYIANTTGGIEPCFALTYGRNIEKQNKTYELVYISDPIFDEYLTTNFDAKTKEKILKQVSDEKGSCQNVKEIPEDIRKVFMVSADLTPMEHLESLAIVARNTSLSVSKTINMSADATKEEISEVYLKAHEMGIIGVTVYRDGCRDGILVHKVEDKKELIVKNNAPKRPKHLPCHVYKMNIMNRITNSPEKWIVFVGLLEDDPYEILAGKIDKYDVPSEITEGTMVKIKRDGKNVYQFVHNNTIIVDDVCGAFINDIQEYSTRLMSLALRHGASIEYIKGILQRTNGTIVDFDKAIIRAINKYVKDVKSKEKCPVCNSDLIYVEGCIKCSSRDCSFSKCG